MVTRKTFNIPAPLKKCYIRINPTPLLSKTGVTVNIHSPKKALFSTYLVANKYSPVFFSQDKKTPGSVYLPVNKYCLGKYLLPFPYSVSIIGHNSHRFTPKASLRQT